MFHDIIEAKHLKVASFMDVLNVLKCHENDSSNRTKKNRALNYSNVLQSDHFLC